MALLVSFIFFLLSILSVVLFLKPSPNNLPPGPFSWPIIGTLLPKLKKQPHVELSKLAQRFGPLMLLKFGVEPVVVASSHVAAVEVLKNQDRLLSGRFAPHSVRIKGYIEHSMVWADCTDYWKMVRKVWRTELFSTKMLDIQAHAREEKVSELMKFLIRKEGEKVNFADVIFGSILNILGALIFSKDVYDFEDRTDNNLGMKGMIRQLMILAAIPNLADLYPILGGSDFQGLRKASAACVKRMNESWAAIVKQRRKNDDHSKNDFLQVLLDSGFSDPQIDAMLLETFGPGSDTSTSTIEWAMAELLRNPEKLVKVREELDRVIRRSNNVKESDLPNLPYLHACVKETLRLHPPVTFLLPHRAMETCQMMNYTIPKGCQLMVNTYAIGRDSKTWEKPLSFLPERFLNSELDYQGNDFQYIPFGAGRRICPGLSLATRVVRLILASLLHTFDWSLPDGMHPDELDMNDKFGLALQKDIPLVVIPKLRK
ncbi:PREDICTED: probable (S)-N-methylcoclaurine 3'-hydroxylase isozyme 2 [Nelumbo nucifera]|uniref:(S)-N-methylcoclaurine 3'-hydroxylase isozyme 2 n=1 Tax=Nelumbo nucifera TaxID=4432 RepID=A0A1U7ZQ12_NELNU|nr:PREDICTED: probable (S)-N-methylcoclaurine 3'-hydroxylase isozyme 2 [Nelumbo nucifera]AXJ91462.1 (S)-N-methylcoclaurine 3'-hydroxylase isozyme 2 [Nelumbo nucifera]WEE66561.1 proaporphine synthase [Nelumbo nucifera]